MKYTYVVLLVMVLIGMFYFGGRGQQSPELSYSNAPIKELSSTYTKRDYCAPEIDTEITSYKLELSAAQKRISDLEEQLKAATETPTPTPSVSETPIPTPTEAISPEAEASPASSSANR